MAFGHPAFSNLLAVPASLFGYALFFAALPAASLSRVFFLSLIWAFSWQLVHNFWLVSLDHQGAFMVLIWLLASLLLAAQLAACITFFKSRPAWLRALAAGSLLGLFEWSRQFGLPAFPWNPAAMPAVATLYSRQFLVLGGSAFLGAWLFVANSFVYLAFTGRLSKAVALTLSAVPTLFGLCWLNFEGSDKGSLKVALIQPNLTTAEREYFGGCNPEFLLPYRQWERLLPMVASVKENVDLFVLPEAAVTIPQTVPISTGRDMALLFQKIFNFLIAEPEYYNNLSTAQALADVLATPLLIGLQEDVGKTAYNSAYLLTQNPPEVYHKRYLLPMGEKVPGEWASAIAARYGIVSSFTEGTEATIFKQKVALGPTICSDEVIAELMRQTRLAGADCFINLSNDGWYPHSKLADVHHTQGVMRAVEMGCPNIRCCNLGLTSAIDARGCVLASTTAGVLVTSVPIITYATPFTKLGEWPFIGLYSFCLLSACFAKKRQHPIC